MLKIRLIIALLIGICFASNAQRTQIYAEPEASFRYGVELYQKEKYAAANKIFRTIIQEVSPAGNNIPNGLMFQNASYYLAVSSYFLEHPDATVLLQNFVQSYPENILSNYAKFYLAKVWFKDAKYKEVIEALKGIETGAFSKNETADYKYVLGYSHFQENDYKNAKTYFGSLKNSGSTFEYPALYYLGFIALSEKNYSESLSYFDKLKDSKNYAKIVPLYITQIYYEQKKYPELIEYATPYSTQSGIKGQDDINHLIGQALFNTKEYIRAMPYLKRWVENGGAKLKAIDYFQLGYVSYMAKDCEAASAQFSKVTTNNDSLAQHATYYMADCYAKMGKKEDARNAFYKASKLKFDAQIRELSSFNYAKLSYETGLSNQSVTLLTEFLTDFPKSKFTDEANELLGTLLFTTRNFKDALEVLEKIENKSTEIKKAYQKVCYYRGLEIYNADNYTQAIELFNKSLLNNYDRGIQCATHFWKGESYFKLGDYENCITSTLKFVGQYSSDYGLPAESSPYSGYYNIGYAYFKNAAYREALLNFEKANKLFNEAGSKLSSKNIAQRIQPDLTLRLADVQFALGNFVASNELYNKVINAKQPGADYATYQKALLEGLEHKQADKISTLKTLIEKYPSSVYIDNAHSELANIYFLDDKYIEAISELDKLIAKRPNSLMVKNAMLTKALIFYNQEQLEKALNQYKAVVDQYPKTTEARDALNGIKNIYVAQNKVEVYFDYLKTISSASISVSSQDSLTFQAAELIYNQSDYEKAITELSKYLKKYPDGYFVLNAKYMRADSYYHKKQFSSALADFTYVNSQQLNTYSEKALQRSASIYYADGDFINAQTSYEKLESVTQSRSTKLEALTGQMRCNCTIALNEKCKTSANKLLWYEFVTPEMKNEAILNLGKLLMLSEDNDKAMVEFTKVVESGNNANAAEARFRMMEIQYKRKDLKTAQATAFEIAEKYPSYDYWIAKAFILLAETYVDQKNYFQAKATLESIIDNYDGNDLKEVAKKRLAEIKNLEGKSN